MAAFYTVNNVQVYYTGGEDSPLASLTGAGPVNIADIRKDYNSSHLYEDPDFPADDTSLGPIGGDSAAQSGKAEKSYEWRRPQELCTEIGITTPQFAVDQDQSLCGANLCSEYDLKQGGLGDCWYVAALQALCTRQAQLDFIIPKDNFNGFDDGIYCGAFHFRFYSMEHCKWVDVVVDDRIPSVCSDRTDNKWAPAFTKIITHDGASVAEFWPALIEKAYAKFIGSYHKLEGGYQTYGIEDFTGGFSEIVRCVENPDVTYESHQRRVANAMAEGNFVGLSTLDLDTAYKNGALEAYTDYKTHGKVRGYKYDEGSDEVEHDNSVLGFGLCKNHAYTLLDAQEIKLKDGSGTRFLVKARNPHARHEWFGPFGDKDDEGWATLEKDLRPKNTAGSTDIEDGVFWIDLHDVVKYFRSLNYCEFGLTEKKGLKFSWIQSNWSAVLQSLELPTGDDEDSPTDLVHYQAFKFEAKRDAVNGPPLAPEYGDKCVAAIQIILGGYHAKMNPNPNFHFILYRVSAADLAKPLSQLYASKQPYFTSSGNIARECGKWAFIKPGQYIIVPVLRTKPHSNGNPILPEEFIGNDIGFAIRLYTENETKLELVGTPEDNNVDVAAGGDNDVDGDDNVEPYDHQWY